MSFFDCIQIAVFAGPLFIITPLLGSHIAKIFTDTPTFLHPLFGWFESLCYRIGGINANEEMTWTTYTKNLLIFNFLGLITVFLLHLLQGYLPLNPQNFPATSWQLAFNTSVSFTTNTNWQSYSGETTLSYLTQMLGLTVQNFLSAATGMAVFAAFTRGFVRKTVDTIGNFWTDLIRCLTYLFLPLSVALALILATEGVVQTLSPYVNITTLENGHQTIPLGPVASQVAIKQLGTNGGGFFGANSAHPFENPSALSNYLEMLALFLIPAASVYAYGILIGSRRHGWLLFFAMAIIWAAGITLALFSEQMNNPVLDAYPVLEGQETRFGTVNSVLWPITTTATANGSVNAMISSLSPLTGGVAMLNLMLGELVFGGVGVGMCSMIMYAILTVFICGLMVGRTPEYLGKKIEKNEMKWVIVAILMPGILILMGAGISSVLPEALKNLGNQGPHGLSELIYAFSSASANNGSAFGGLNANTNYFNLVLGLVMLIARLAIIIPSLALAGLLARKKTTPTSPGTLSTNTFLFFTLLISIILIEGALTFFPAISLGPIIEHLLMLKGQSF